MYRYTHYNFNHNIKIMSTNNKPIKCIHGVGCYNPGCKYLHDVPFCSDRKCSVPCCGYRHVVICKYGTNCKYFPNCMYRHLGVNWCHPSLGNCEVGKIHCIYHPNI